MQSTATDTNEGLFELIRSFREALEGLVAAQGRLVTTLFPTIQTAVLIMFAFVASDQLKRWARSSPVLS